MDINTIKQYDGKIINLETLDDIWDSEWVEKVENIGYSGSYYGYIWYVATLTDGTEIDLYKIKY
jgi:uncharacterized membrane protein YpjA